MLVSAVALTFPHRPAGWLPLLLLHLVLAALLLPAWPDRFRTGENSAWALAGAHGGTRDPTGSPAQRRDTAAPLSTRIAEWLADWYPLIMVPAVYLEIQVLNRAIWDGHYFDATIMAWEEAVFGGQPSVTLAGQWDSLLLSELLHLAYLSFYFVVLLLPAWLYIAGRKEAFRRTVFTLMLAFVAHYLVFVFFPVQGPRYLFPGPGGTQTDGVLYRLARAVLEGGSSQGAAFPSSHVGLAAVQTVSALRYAPRAAPLLAVLTVGIAVGAVYGGFHYAVDASVGLAAGVLLGLAAPWVWRHLR